VRRDNAILALYGIIPPNHATEDRILITKRMVGLALALFGLAIVGGAAVVDLAGAGKWNGLGPAQQQAIAAGVFVILVGLSLIPLGDRPA
jgi:hypothetical protein